mmetsp:Transcript_3186/g.7430  ORF Transcript_3186/g.7430 Transcript_3186/m.7430 type:complete len:436 (+) Transcript_3186:99-1406(+)
MHSADATDDVNVACISVELGGTRAVYRVGKIQLTKKPTPLPGAVTFGVEIEFCSERTRENLCEILSAEGIDCVTAGRLHDAKSAWKLTTDSSVQCSVSANGCGRAIELVSPILQGERGINSLKAVLAVVNTVRNTINKSMGLHVHIGVKDLSLEEKSKICQQFIKFEEAFDQIVPRSRRSNENKFAESNACNSSLQNISFADKIQKLGRVRSFGELCALMNPNECRYFKLNLQAFKRHGTFEFRQHSGTTNFLKMSYWIRLLTLFCYHSKVLPAPEAFSTDTPHEKLNLMFTKVVKDGALKEYFTARAAELKRAAELNNSRHREIKRVQDYFEHKTKFQALKEMCDNLIPYASKVGIPPPVESLSSITQCKKYLEKIYLNIFDYVDEEYKKNPELIKTNRKDLLKRCILKKRGFFPKKEAKGSTLKSLLKVLSFV